MILKKITLTNYRGFKNIEIPIGNDKHGQAMFIGNNGCGKTTVLEAIATGLSWFIARVHEEKGIGDNIDDDQILNSAQESFITLDVDHKKEFYQWTIAGTRKGTGVPVKNTLTGVTELAYCFRTSLTVDRKNTSLPMIAYYSADRSVTEASFYSKVPRISNRLDGYTKALQAGKDFSYFFKWFQERENYENENVKDLISEYFSGTEGESYESVHEYLKDKLESSKDIPLDIVRKSITSFIPELSNFHIKRDPSLRMMARKNDGVLNVNQLSQGELSLMALIGDVSRRLTIMNPALDNPLDGEGIILIDEIALSLHPVRQKNIVRDLSKTFPNCQFIMTTHSPIIINDEKLPKINLPLT